jgi:hypothetical protein
MNTPTEHQEQVMLIKWCELNKTRYPGLDLIFAIPNGANKSRVAAAQFKAEGLKSGVPDLFLPIAKSGCYGLFIEMKRKKPKGTVSKNQWGWIDSLLDQGYGAVVCYGFEDAKQVIEDYLQIK